MATHDRRTDSKMTHFWGKSLRGVWGILLPTCVLLGVMAGGAFAFGRSLVEPVARNGVSRTSEASASPEAKGLVSLFVNASGSEEPTDTVPDGGNPEGENPDPGNGGGGDSTETTPPASLDKPGLIDVPKVNTKTAELVVAAVTIESVEPAGYDKLKVSWELVSGATGYRVQYRLGSGSWVNKDVSATTDVLTLTKLKTGKKYSVRVCGFVTKDTITVYGQYSATHRAVPRPAQVAGLKLVLARKHSYDVSFSWKKVAGATNYEVYHKAGSGKWTKVKTVAARSHVITLRNDTNKYQFKVRAYRSVGHAKSYGAFSLPLKCTTVKASSH